MMNKFSDFFKRNTLGIFSGLLIGTSYIPFPPWAILFCYAPLWYALIQSKSLKQSFWLGWLCQFVLTLIGFHWIAYVSHEFGYMPWPVAILILVVFAALVHLYIPLMAILSRFLADRFHLKTVEHLLLLALLTSLSEIYWPSVFPWNLGYSFLWIRSPIAQWADTIGFAGLSFLIYLINAVIVFVWLKRDQKLAIGSFAAVFTLLLGLHFSGKVKKQQWESSDTTLKALTIQANIGNFEKIAAEKGRGFQQEIANRYFAMTERALAENPGTQLVLWPESAYPDFLNVDQKSRLYSQQFFEFVKKVKTPILTGGYSIDPIGTNNPKDYNGLFLFDENGQALGPPYHKTFLLMYGEYTPMSQWFPWMAKYSPAGTGFGRGNGPHVFDFRDYKIGVQICYESLYPEFSVGLEDLGADLIVNLTNDSWFGPTFEPHQHLYMTMGRAIEVRRPLLRSTNTGINSAVLASGDILHQSPIGQEWAGVFELNFLKDAPRSFFARFGTWLGWILLLSVVLILLNGKRRARSQTPGLE